MNVVETGTDTAKESTIQILEILTRDGIGEEIRFRFWDGTTWSSNRSAPATVVLNRPSALREMLLAGTEDGLGEAFIRSAFDIEGDFEAAFRFGDRLMQAVTGLTDKVKVGYHVHRLPHPPIESLARAAELTGDRHSLKRDKDAIRFHYDVSNDFYRLWLDPWLAYSCAYFSDPDHDLGTAQIAKFDHICRKLGLKRGQRLLDIGCGWGGLLIHAAKHYGIIGHGITLSENQAELARDRIRELGLEDKITIWIEDYRALRTNHLYDAIVSVGMVEHVGLPKLEIYFRQALNLLKPGGLFMNHGIGLGPVPLPETNGSFIDRFVFPDTDLLPIDQMLKPAHESKFEIRDVECLREHYATTLTHWVRNLEAHKPDALLHVTEEVYRIWWLYMAGCAYRFRQGQLSIYQTLLAKLRPDGTSDAPSTRAAWYATTPIN